MTHRMKNLCVFSVFHLCRRGIWCGIPQHQENEKWGRRRAPDYSSNLCPPKIYDLYDFLGGVLGPFTPEKEQEAGPKRPLKKSYRSYFRRAPIRWVIWRSSSMPEGAFHIIQILVPNSEEVSLSWLSRFRRRYSHLTWPNGGVDRGPLISSIFATAHLSGSS